MQLPTRTAAVATDVLPDRHTIEVRPDGSVRFNGSPIARSSERLTLHGLIATLRRVKATSDRMGQQVVILVMVDPIAPHFKTIEVLDACAAADIQYVSFGNH